MRNRCTRFLVSIGDVWIPTARAFERSLRDAITLRIISSVCIPCHLEWMRQRPMLGGVRWQTMENMRSLTPKCQGNSSEGWKCQGLLDLRTILYGSFFFFLFPLFFVGWLGLFSLSSKRNFFLFYGWVGVCTAWFEFFLFFLFFFWLVLVWFGFVIKIGKTGFWS